MPNRVDGNANVARPTVGQNEARQANRASESAQAETQPVQRDRVEISDQARLRADQTRPSEGAQDTSGAAADAPSAHPEAGDQGVNQAVAQQAEQLNETREQNIQENVQEPPERQGNLVDVVG